MKKNKKILVVFHMNFLNNDRGCKAYIYEIVKTLHAQGYEIDFFTTNKYENFSDFDTFNKQGIINQLFCCENVDVQDNPSLNPYTDLVYGKWVNDAVLKRFQTVIDENNYDVINFHYPQWIDLAKFAIVPQSTKIIYSMHDLNFVQDYFSLNDNYAQTLKKELSLLDYVDEIACISFDEMMFIQRLKPETKCSYLPHFLPYNPVHSGEKDIDVLFLAADNQYNLEGILWFLDNVTPYLHSETKITICGKIWKLLDAQPSEVLEKLAKLHINRIDFADDLDVLFNRTKISIVPMFKGTGLKIKTIDAMSRNVPIVSTLLGVDGFPDKFSNGCLVTDNAEKFAFYINKLLDDETYYLEVKKLSAEYFNKFFSEKACLLTLRELFIQNDVQSRKVYVKSVEHNSPIENITTKKMSVKKVFFLGIPVLKIEKEY